MDEAEDIADRKSMGTDPCQAIAESLKEMDEVQARVKLLRRSVRKLDRATRRKMWRLS